MEKRGAFFLILSLFFAAGCGKKESDVGTIQQATPAATIFSGVKSVDPATTAVLKGKALFQGEVPPAKEFAVGGNPECAALHPGGKIPSEELLVKGGFIQNVFVYVKEGLESYHFDPPSHAVPIDNKNCVYVPHVTGAQVNQVIALSNSDPTLHNIHSFSKHSRPWNLGLPFQGMAQAKKFTAVEVMVTLKCDVHPWMLGYVGVLPHPYFGVTDENGNFQIANLPPGEYRIEAWHEKLGVQSQTVKIEPRETKEITFKF